mmetsp:Transcript_39264/g.91752  ORF Transcript_39264/g.91752 Transcript_39264/m.91752 type:complete len:206 (+) Transcript_39264:1088-1705(+)
MLLLPVRPLQLVEEVAVGSVAHDEHHKHLGPPAHPRLLLVEKKVVVAYHVRVVQLQEHLALGQRLVCIVKVFALNLLDRDRLAVRLPAPQVHGGEASRAKLAPDLILVHDPPPPRFPSRRRLHPDAASGTLCRLTLAPRPNLFLAQRLEIPPLFPTKAPIQPRFETGEPLSRREITRCRTVPSIVGRTREFAREHTEQKTLSPCV